MTVDRVAIAAAYSLIALGCGRLDFSPTSPISGDATLAGSDAIGPAQEAIGFLQGSAIVDGVVMTASTMFASPVAMGDLILVGGSLDGPPPSAFVVTDTMGNSYTTISTGVAAPFVVFLTYAIATASGPDTISETINTPPNTYLELQAWDYAGVASDGFEDCAQAIGSSLAVDGVTTRPLNVSSMNELIFAWGVFDLTGVAGTDYTQLTDSAGDLAEQRVVMTPGSYPATMTMSAGTNWTIVGATFRGQ